MLNEDKNRLPINDKNFATVKLLKPHLVGTYHYLPGNTVTVGKDRAKVMIEAGAAVGTKFDPSAVPPPPAKRPYLRTDGVVGYRTADLPIGNSCERAITSHASLDVSPGKKSSRKEVPDGGKQ